MPFNPASSLAKLLDAPVRPGRVLWLGLRPERRAPVKVVDQIVLESGRAPSGTATAARTAGGLEDAPTSAQGLVRADPLPAGASLPYSLTLPWEKPSA